MKSVDVKVHLGDPNRARAGKGKDAKTATCTSSPTRAAVAAAAKFFNCDTTEIVLLKARQGDTCARIPTTCVAEYHPKGRSS